MGWYHETFFVSKEKMINEQITIMGAGERTQESGAGAEDSPGMIEIYAEVSKINKVKKEGDDLMRPGESISRPKWLPLELHYHAAQFASPLIRKVLRSESDSYYAWLLTDHFETKQWPRN